MAIFGVTATNVREISQEIRSSDLSDTDINGLIDIAEGQVFAATRKNDWSATVDPFFFPALKGAVLLYSRALALKHFGRSDLAEQDFSQFDKIIARVMGAMSGGQAGAVPGKAIFWHV